MEKSAIFVYMINIQFNRKWVLYTWYIFLLKTELYASLISSGNVDGLVMKNVMTWFFVLFFSTLLIFVKLAENSQPRDHYWDQHWLLRNSLTSSRWHCWCWCRKIMQLTCYEMANIFCLDHFRYLCNSLNFLCPCVCCC